MAPDSKLAVLDNSTLPFVQKLRVFTLPSRKIKNRFVPVIEYKKQNAVFSQFKQTFLITAFFVRH